MDRELLGWIQSCKSELSAEDAQRELESLGIDIGNYNSEKGEFQNCVVSADAFNRLEPLWGKYIWGLE